MCHHSARAISRRGFGLILFGLWLFCVFDVITTDAALCRNLPKAAWVLIVLLFFDVGAVAWLVAGRTWNSAATNSSMPYKGNPGRPARGFPEYDRPGRFALTNPDDDEAFLAQVRVRAEAQRHLYEHKRREELQREQDNLHRRPDEK
jgi:phospholipase D-like protein